MEDAFWGLQYDRTACSFVSAKLPTYLEWTLYVLHPPNVSIGGKVRQVFGSSFHFTLPKQMEIEEVKLEVGAAS